ncbi:nuclear transport factor 2 family protein [Chryseobacterium sp. DT-3]|uniref:nuclear transport factor 2 family protein n=1 Tax=Chryseobacterium sp. DT-3 TaxID=3396164 RepID=UPI003F1D6494
MKNLFWLWLILFASCKIFAQNSSDQQAVRETLMNYLNGRNNGDTLMLSSAFHQSADLRYINKDRFTIWPVADYIKKIKPGNKQNCISRIISINIANNAAQAFIEIEYPKRLFSDYINLLKIDGKWLIANKIFSNREIETTKRILFITTSHEDLGNTGKKTGLHLGEVVDAYKVLHENGFEIDFANPAGKRSRMYGADINNQATLTFLQNPVAFYKFNNPLKLSEVSAHQYAAVYVVGGHGVMWDLALDQSAASVIKTIYERNGIVSAVCHGPAALVNIRLKDGSFLVKGKKLTAFTNDEEKENSTEKIVPFLLENGLKKSGGIFSSAPLWQSHIVKDGRLITGQNPASTTALAKEIVKTFNDEIIPIKQ